MPIAADRLVRAARLPALLLAAAALAAPAPARGPALGRGAFFVEVEGRTAIINARLPGSPETCILGTGSSAVLDRIARHGYAQRIAITFERLARPAFPPDAPGLNPRERTAQVHGQPVAPWCASPELYWITSFAPAW